MVPSSSDEDTEVQKVQDHPSGRTEQRPKLKTGQRQGLFAMLLLARTEGTAFPFC